MEMFLHALFHYVVSFLWHQFLFLWLPSDQSYVWMKSMQPASTITFKAGGLNEINGISSFFCSLSFAPAWLIKSPVEELSYYLPHLSLLLKWRIQCGL